MAGVRSFGFCEFSIWGGAGAYLFVERYLSISVVGGIWGHLSGLAFAVRCPSDAIYAHANISYPLVASRMTTLLISTGKGWYWCGHHTHIIKFSYWFIQKISDGLELVGDVFSIDIETGNATEYYLIVTTVSCR